MNDFISKFVNHLRDDLGFSEPKIAKFKHAIRRFINEVLPERDGELATVIRNFRQPQNLSIYLMSNDLWIGNKEDKIFVGIKRPIWSTGLRELSKDEEVRDIISWFLHYSEQYIMRAYHVSIIGAINLVYDLEADFIGESIINLFDSGELRGSYYGFINHKLYNTVSRNSRTLGFWISTINAFDPTINRMIYNYNKAINLKNQMFWEEAIVSCDKTVNVIEQFYKRIQCVDNSLIRKGMITFFLDESYCDIFKRLYDLRCFFGAHPSSTKWWDFAEIYELELDRIFEALKSLLMRVFIYESHNRVPAYEYRGKVPSDWLKENLVELFQSCWFSDLP